MDFTDFKPMLAKDYDPAKLQFPVYASPKLDGIRASVVDGRLLARSLKPIPNKGVYTALSRPELNGLDGELIVGSATAPDVMRTTTSHVMSKDKEFDFTYFVFDNFLNPSAPYTERLKALTATHATAARVAAKLRGVNVVLLQQALLKDHDQLVAYEHGVVKLGYEGVILRSPSSLYKFGRSTVNEGYLLKVKRFEDSEAQILGFEEQMRNGNEATTNELGRTKRSSHKANKTGKGTLGALHVKDLVTGIDFHIGTGMDDRIRQEIWDDQDGHHGRIVKYKYLPVGVKEKPRHPVFLGFRDLRDM